MQSLVRGTSQMWCRHSADMVCVVHLFFAFLCKKVPHSSTNEWEKEVLGGTETRIHPVIWKECALQNLCLVRHCVAYEVQPNPTKNLQDEECVGLSKTSWQPSI